MRVLRTTLLNWLAVTSVIGLYYIVLVALLMTFGMDEHILGDPMWLPIRFAGGLCIAILGGISLAFTGKRSTTPSTLFLTFQLAFVHIPSCAFCAVHDRLPMWFAVLTAVVLIIIGLSVRPLAKILTLPPPISAKVFLGFLLLVWIVYAIFVFLLAIIQKKYSFAAGLDMVALYAYRADIFSSLSGKELAALSALGYFLLPLFMIIATENRRWVMAVLLLIPIVMLYGVTGIKTYLFVPGFTLITYLMARRFQNAGFVTRFLMMILILLLVAASVGFYLEIPLLLALLFRRAVMTPGELHLIYSDYFADSPRLPIWQFLANTSPEGSGLNWAELVQLNVFGGTVGSGEGANSGMLASAFAVYGLYGVAFYVIILLCTLAFLDGFTASQSRSWLPFAAIPSLFLMTNMDFISATLFYGLGFVVICTICMYRKKRLRHKNSNFQQQLIEDQAVARL